MIKTIEKEVDYNLKTNEATSYVQFSTGNTLQIDQSSNQIKLINNKGELQLEITINSTGLVVNLNAAELNINASEELNLSSKKVNINASEQINIKTKGNLVQEVDKDLLTEVGGTNKQIAQVQKITATLGGVDIKANDDVRLDGESVKLNCT
jgi:hypothetical protein